MIDVTTRQPLLVSTDNPAWPYITVPVSQLAELQELLEAHDVRYHVDEHVISFEGAPEEALVLLARGTDAAAVQAILDAAA